MWPDLQALDLGAIQSIAAVKKAGLDLATAVPNFPPTKSEQKWKKKK
jgi:hypothetical protein